MDPKGRILAEPSSHLDHFDLLPDKVVLLIFNKLADVRSLGRCSAVCRRFNSLVFLVHDVYIKIARVVTADGDFDDPFCPSSPTFTASKEVTSLSFLQLSHHSPGQVLKDFTHVRNLHIELPSGNAGTEEGVLLKWRAEFGSTLQKCVILGGTRVDLKPASELE